MKKIFSKEVIIGLTVLVALAILVVGIDFLKGINIFKAANYYVATYTNVQGLAVSAPVSVNGFKVGQVREISYEYDNPGHVKVEMSLNKNLKLPEGTQAVIKTDMLGTATIELNMGHGGTYYNVGDEIEGTIASGLMDNVTDKILPSVGDIMPKIDSLLTSLNKVVSDPALLQSMQRLDKITSNIDVTTNRLAQLVGSLPAVVNDVKGLTSNLSKSTDDITVLTERMRNIPVDSLADNVAQITANLKELSAQLNDPNSTIGKLTHDPALYNNLNSTISSLDSLFVDIKKNPKRYISIKLL
ncbi:MAG: MlaD family protein [Muribaculaceae bacterium]|nr:MlaD family protein [Muribaculaceae bacterium]